MQKIMYQTNFFNARTNLIEKFFGEIENKNPFTVLILEDTSI